MRNKICLYAQLVIAIILIAIAKLRTDFSPTRIAIELISSREGVPSDAIIEQLGQPFHFFAKGRQSFVFESEDQKTILKFFDRKYIEVPWYSQVFDFQNEKHKRDLRHNFYENSYQIAEKYFQEETALLYVHLHQTKNLPQLQVIDKVNRTFLIDLNHVPFILQKKASPLYPSLQQNMMEQGEAYMKGFIQSFFGLIAHRITLGIADNDHDIEHNFGMLEGKLLHLDPGRLSYCDFSNNERRDLEWWRSTHRLRKWLEKNYPEMVSFFDQELQKNRHTTEFF